MAANKHVFEVRVASGQTRNPSVYCHVGDSIRIGSATGIGIQLIDENVDPAHVRLEVFEDSVHALDLRSRNGMSVNGEKCDQAYLKDGDAIQVGDCELQILGSDPGFDTFDKTITLRIIN